MKSLSIHPRVRDGRTAHEKVNTAKPWKGGGKLAYAQKHLGERRVAHSATIKSLPNTVNPASFRAPGSMKGRS